MNSNFENDVKTVLVVDDEPSICMVVSEMLAACNVRVLTANDGYEAVRLLQQEGDRVSLAMLDYSMPGMDCEILIQKLRQMNHQLKLVISSGEPGQLFEDPQSLGITAMIPKPYGMRQLVDLVLSLMDAPPNETSA